MRDRGKIKIKRASVEGKLKNAQALKANSSIPSGKKRKDGRREKIFAS